MKYILYTDGGSRGNPGPAAAGAVLKKLLEASHWEIVGEWGRYLGIATNNQAEYEALIMGLEQAKSALIQDLECRLDSELLVKQMKREYRVKDPHLAKLFVKAWNIAATFSRISFHHIPREQNTEADRMVNSALDEELKK